MCIRRNPSGSGSGIDLSFHLQSRNSKESFKNIPCVVFFLGIWSGPAERVCGRVRCSVCVWNKELAKRVCSGIAFVLLNLRGCYNIRIYCACTKTKLGHAQLYGAPFSPMQTKTHQGWTGQALVSHEPPRHCSTIALSLGPSTTFASFFFVVCKWPRIIECTFRVRLWEK